MPNVIKISAKIKAMQNINILLFVHSLSFTSLKLCSKARKAYRQSKHQHSKNLTRWIKATGTKNTRKMQTVCKRLFTKVLKCSPFAQIHAWRRFQHWSIAVSMMSCRKLDHTTIKCSFRSLKTVSEQKVKW